MTDPANNQVSFTNESLGYLKESGGWGTFLSIVGFCYVGLIIMLGIFADRLFAAAGAPGALPFMMSAIYICIGVLYFFPVLYLFRFSQEVKNALKLRSTEAMTIALGNLKSLFKFMGIVTAIGIALMVLAMLSFGAGALFN